MDFLGGKLDMTNCLLSCSNNGRCDITDGKAKCKCYPHYAGPACEIDLKPCSTKPCLNNGTCHQNLTTYTFNCECTQFYEGIFCQNKIDICMNETCSKNGNCKDVDNVPKCFCFYLFLGEKCEIQSESKKAIVKAVSTTSAVAITVIGFFYTSFIVLDILRFFFSCGL